MKIKKQKTFRSKYKSITSSERAQIINFIEEYKYSTSHVSMITGHNASTIKAIYQIYKKEGRINKKEKRDKILNKTSSLMLFVNDDIHGNLTKISVEQHETQKQIRQEEKLTQSDNFELPIKQLLEQCKLKVSLLLDNQKAIDTFLNEIKIISQCELTTQEFTNLLSPSCINKNECWQANQKMNKNFLFFQDLDDSENQENTNSDERRKSIIIKKLDEQYRLMKM